MEKIEPDGSKFDEIARTVEALKRPLTRDEFHQLEIEICEWAKPALVCPTCPVEDRVLGQLRSNGRCGNFSAKGVRRISMKCTKAGHSKVLSLLMKECEDDLVQAAEKMLNDLHDKMERYDLTTADVADGETRGNNGAIDPWCSEGEMEVDAVNVQQLGMVEDVKSTESSPTKRLNASIKKPKKRSRVAIATPDRKGKTTFSILQQPSGELELEYLKLQLQILQQKMNEMQASMKGLEDENALLKESVVLLKEQNEALKEQNTALKHEQAETANKRELPMPQTNVTMKQVSRPRETKVQTGTVPNKSAEDKKPTFAEVAKKMPPNGKKTKMIKPERKEIKAAMNWLLPRRPPVEFEKTHICLNLDRESKKLNRSQLYRTVGHLLKTIGIRSMVKEMSFIGRSILEIYHEKKDSDAVRKMLGDKGARRIELDISATNPITGKTPADVEKQMVNRIADLLRRNEGVKMRECILAGIPDNIRQIAMTAEGVRRENTLEKWIKPETNEMQIASQC